MDIIANTNIKYLLDALLKDYKEHYGQLGAFGEYIIAVPNKSIENWLTAEIVKRIGICSAIRFESLHKLLNNTFRRGAVEQAGLLNKRQLSAVLFQLLSKLNEKEVVSSHALMVLKVWLSKQDQAQSMAQLCLSLADTFELYQTYRPDWLDAWEQKKTVLSEPAELWQAELWRLICAELPQNTLLHRAQLTESFKAILEAESSNALQGLRQLAIFGVNQLDVSTLTQLKLMSQRLPVTYFWQPASAELFGTEHDAKANQQLVLEQKAYFVGQVLLASWGGSSRQQALLFSELGIKSRHESCKQETVDTQPDDLLSHIKAELINNRYLPRKLEAEVYESEDNSICINAHFSRFREVEGLYDYLLEQFSQDKSLKPDDVIVMCPDINAYASYVHAVFENQSTDKAIPFQVCGVNAATSDVASVLMSLIDLPRSRYELSSVVDLLNQSVVKKRFGLSTEDVEQIHAWFTQSNAYWGLDKTTLKQLKLPEFDRYTLQTAVDRMVLGLSLDGTALRLDDDLLYGIEGISALQSSILSKLIMFMDALVQWRDVCTDSNGEVKSYSASQWAEYIRGLTNTFIDVPHKELDSLNAWYHLLTEFENGFIDTELDYNYAYVSSQLRLAIEDSATSAFSYRFGKTNIGSFGALKGIPAKVIAILGLNEADFPRKPAADSINLAIRQPRLGDRNQIEQDKDTFLMALLNCSSRFYCSYVGQDMRSNAKRIPSVVLQELLDLIQPNVKKQKAIVIQHPMKSYSKAYFEKNGRLYTYQNFESQESLLADQDPDIANKLTLPLWEMPEQITVQMLKAFLEDPAKAFFKTRFNVDLPELDDDAGDEEPMATNPLTRWKFIDELLQRGVEQGDINAEMIADISLPYLASGLMENDYFAQESLQSWVDIAKAVLDNVMKVKGQKKPTVQSVNLTLNVDGIPLNLVGDINLFCDASAADVIHLAHKNGKQVSEKYLMRAIVDARIAEALKVENQVNYNSSFLACQDKVYRLEADTASGKNSLETWLRLYKSVMNAPIALDIVSATKMHAGNTYRDDFEQMLEDSAGPFSNMRLSKAMLLLSHDVSAVARGEKFVKHFQYLKPGKTADEIGSKPQWIEVVQGEAV
ncbi:exodeoxyribonuclease V subunit gamma [Rheinheimera sp. UJ63]|uniref:exodeoxyribonuclease V subunit gamma n=1 Tax=Rheinheimera sp. UJ63 TaxID=2910157 RepID=UPI001F160602|nr:exodeoxyribonuclease V subunit gamma [Rheinheimera sp. UJ63]MCF4010656.1 exodeoxyribonuclease V subunit gamma [Rheinheimera sp. UJ63]